MENTKRNSSTAIVRKEIFNTCLLEVRHVIRNRFLIASGEWREANGEGVRFKVSFSFDFQGLPQFVACGIQHTNCSIEQAKSHFRQPGSQAATWTRAALKVILTRVLRVFTAFAASSTSNKSACAEEGEEQAVLKCETAH